jgi:hypothetical protein
MKLLNKDTLKKDSNKLNYRMESILIGIIITTWIIFSISFFIFFAIQPSEVFRQYEFESWLVFKSFGILCIVLLIYFYYRINKKMSVYYSSNEEKNKRDKENNIIDITVDEMIDEMKACLKIIDSYQFNHLQNNSQNLALKSMIDDIEKKITIIEAEINKTKDPLKVSKLNEDIVHLTNFNNILLKKI